MYYIYVLYWFLNVLYNVLYNFKKSMVTLNMLEVITSVVEPEPVGTGKFLWNRNQKKSSGSGSEGTVI